MVGTGAIPVYGAGTVRPVAEIDVATEINGKVVWVDSAFQSGGRVRKGQVLFRIDDADYRNRVQQARANVAAQHVALLRANEEAQIARAEYTQFRSDQTDIAGANPLALWEPQLEAARAAVVRDSAVLADAELALARTKVPRAFQRRRAGRIDRYGAVRGGWSECGANLRDRRSRGGSSPLRRQRGSHSRPVGVGRRATETGGLWLVSSLNTATGATHGRAM